ncbi:MAG: hypothetical protein KGL39_26610 [Patescibacteria group bacterium]|nr:hypothetical protein [Patescibacteria group bacterium]
MSTAEKPASAPKAEGKKPAPKSEAQKADPAKPVGEVPAADPKAAAKLKAAKPKAESKAESEAKPKSAKPKAEAKVGAGAKGGAKPKTEAAAEKKAAKPKAAKAGEKKAKAGEKKEDDNKGGEDEKKRQRWSDVLDISISSARCQTHLRNRIINKEIKAELKEMRTRLKALGDSEDKKEEREALKAEIKKKGQEQLRMSSETPVAAATVADYMIKELIDFGLNEVVSAEKGTLSVIHLHEKRAEGLLTFSLIRNLPSYRDFNAEEEKQRKGKEEHKEEAAAEGEATTGAKMTFKTYVEAAIAHQRKQDERFASLRVSTRIREYCSDLIVEFMAHIAMLAQDLITKHSDGEEEADEAKEAKEDEAKDDEGRFSARTLTAGHIKTVISILLKNEHRDPKDIHKLLKYVDDKVQRYKEHVKAARAEKPDAELTDEEKAAKAEKEKDKAAKKHKKILEKLEKAKQAQEKAQKELEEVHHATA